MCSASLKLANIGAKRLAHSDTVAFLEAMLPTCLNQCVWTFFLRSILVLEKCTLSMPFVFREVAYVQGRFVFENAIAIELVLLKVALIVVFRRILAFNSAIPLQNTSSIVHFPPTTSNSD